MNEWKKGKNEIKNKWTHERTNERKNKRMNERKKNWTSESNYSDWARFPPRRSKRKVWTSLEAVYNFRMDSPENYCSIWVSTEMLGGFGGQCFKSKRELIGDKVQMKTTLFRFSKKKNIEQHPVDQSARISGKVTCRIQTKLEVAHFHRKLHWKILCCFRN